LSLKTHCDLKAEGVHEKDTGKTPLLKGKYTFLFVIPQQSGNFQLPLLTVKTKVIKNTNNQRSCTMIIITAATTTTTATKQR